MCGIAGIIHYNTLAGAGERLEAMTRALDHRGPDHTQHLVLPQAAFGHCRLSIIDLSSDANQPFTDASGRYILLYNGEIYNYQELKQAIPEYPYTTSSDTEVILAAFSKWGIECVHHLNGMFAFAIWDKKEETLWLARDRFGTKPLLVHHGNNCVVFASERRALLQSGLIKPEIDERGLFDYLSFQSSGYPKTMISSIDVMPPGTYMKVNKHGHELTTYWNYAHIAVDNQFDRDQLQPVLLDKLHQAVSSRLTSDVPLAVFLSGGLDSSAVVALTSLANTQSINTFHLSVNNIDTESSYAETIAKRFQTNHIEYKIREEDILHKVTDGLDAMDSPTMDGINTFLLSNVIREKGFKVALSGLGGDELFGGYPGFKQYMLLNEQQGIYNVLRSVRKLASFISSFGASSSLRRYGALLAVDTVTIDQIYPVLRQILTQTTIKDLTRLSNVQSNLQTTLTSLRPKFQHLELMSQYTVAEMLGYVHNTLLRDADQMGMSVGLEIREPLFDHRLVEFMLSLPDAIKNSKKPKQLFFDTLEPLLPPEIFYRPKKGFVLPWDHWMRNELYSFCEEQINRISQRSQFNSTAVQRLWKNFNRSHPHVRWTEVWIFVVLGYWMDKNGIQ